MPIPAEPSDVDFADWLFVETLSDLRHRCTDPAGRPTYELLGIAGLLRKLLADQEPLVDAVNRTRRVRIRYHLRPHAITPVTPHGEVTILQFAKPPIYDADEPPLTRDAFFATPIGEIIGHQITVKETITYFAHVEGGVHAGRPEGELQEMLAGLRPMTLSMGVSWAEILAHIGTVVLNAFAELEQLVRASVPADIPRRMATLMRTVPQLAKSQAPQTRNSAPHPPGG